MFKKENLPLWFLSFSFLVLAILTRVSQMAEPVMPFLTRLMLTEFTFFVALAGVYFAYQLTIEKGRQFKFLLAGGGCVVAAVLLFVMGWDLWQQLPPLHLTAN